MTHSALRARTQVLDFLPRLPSCLPFLCSSKQHTAIVLAPRHPSSRASCLRSQGPLAQLSKTTHLNKVILTASNACLALVQGKTPACDSRTGHCCPQLSSSPLHIPPEASRLNSLHSRKFIKTLTSLGNCDLRFCPSTPSHS